jgi:hypothetical protein
MGTIEFTSTDGRKVGTLPPVPPTAGLGERRLKKSWIHAFLQHSSAFRPDSAGKIPDSLRGPDPSAWLVSLFRGEEYLADPYNARRPILVGTKIFIVSRPLYDFRERSLTTAP